MGYTKHKALISGIECAVRRTMSLIARNRAKPTSITQGRVGA
jgi:hypothetical protein